MTRSNESPDAVADASRHRTATPAAYSMPRLFRKLSKFTVLLASISVIGIAGTVSAHSTATKTKARLQPTKDHHVGYASYYAQKFSGRKMADGTPMRPESDNAASLSLPLGSKALVTNLRNGRTALVTIRDRGPFVKGRIIDVSPSTAKMLGTARGSRNGFTRSSCLRCCCRSMSGM